MKERPILFSAPMVRAILEGRKVQTRRVITLKSSIFRAGPTAIYRMMPEGDALLERWPIQERMMNNFGRCERVKCPYGVPGDRLWVKETWQPQGSEWHRWPEFSYRPHGEPVNRSVSPIIQT